MINSERFGQKLYVLPSEAANYSNAEGWEVVAMSKNNFNIDGHQYTVVEKRERYIPLCSIKRITDIVIGLIFCVCTLGLALASKTVRQFFTGRQVVKIIKPELPLNLNPSKPESSPNLNPPQIDLEDGSSIDESSYKLTKKIFEPFVVGQIPDFKTLTDDQVIKLLDVEPKLKTLDAAQGTMKAYESILSIHTEGIPKRLGYGTSNSELMNQMRFILFKINQESSKEKQKSKLRELAACIEDCVPVTQGKISQLYERYASMGGLDAQVSSFVSAYKERIVDEVIYALYPEMQDPSYAQAHHNTPYLQFPHMKTGFLVLLGDQFGLNIAGAKEDPNRNTQLSTAALNNFRELFTKKISIREIVREFIIDVNGRNGSIDIQLLAKWCTPENLGEEANNVFYDSSIKYPSYSPAYKPIYGYEPYLTEKVAYLIFENMGYLVGSS